MDVRSGGFSSHGVNGMDDPAEGDRAPGFCVAMRYYPSSTVAIHPVVMAIAVFGVGFFLQCNIATNALGLRFLRASDVMVLAGLPLLGLLYMRILSAGILALHVLPLTFAFLLAAMFGEERGDGEFYPTAFTFFYALFFLFFTHVLFRERQLATFCWGVLAGFLAVSLLLFLDLSMQPQLAAIGLSHAFDEQAVLEAAARGEFSPMLLRVDKAGGLWAAGNEAGPTFALAAAAAAYLAERYRRIALYVLFLVVFALTFTQTLNRSGLLAVLLIGLLLYARLFSLRLLLRSYLGLLLLAGALALALPFGLLDWIETAFSKRFLQDANSIDNLGERFASLLAGIEVMAAHPFGIGVEARFAQMQALSGVATPHNGFVTTAYTSGVLHALLVTGAIAYVFLRRRKVSFFLYAAIAVTAGYLFEELNLNPVFMSYAGLVMAYAAIDLDFLAVKVWRLRRHANG